uniref:Microtubule-associated protein n=1 Tax=Scleropages formosus TaxID=113540 RepID=A0A8C9TQS5_SCLFO
MSSFSKQQSADPFSEYSELCKVSSVQESQGPQGWAWQHGEIGPPRSLAGPPRVPGLTDEDKLCFFDGPAGVGVEPDLKVPGRAAGGVSLGSAGESPESPLSSSPSPCSKSPASPGKLGASPSYKNSAATAPTNGSPSRHSGGSVSPDLHKPADISVWNPSFGGAPEFSPKPGAQAPPNYCVIGIVNDNYLDGGDDVSGASSEESEDEVAPTLMGRADQQRKAMRRAMSECSHLSVPASLELPDKYPDKYGALDELPSPGGGPRHPLSSMKRSLTVSDEQPPTPPPTLSTAGVTRNDLRQEAEPSPKRAPFPPLPKGGGNFALEALDVSQPEKDQGIMLLVPIGGQAFNTTGVTNGKNAVEVQPEKADTFEKTDNSQMVEKIDALEKMDKPEKTDKPEKVDKSEKIDKDENSNKVEKVEKSDQIEKLDKEKEKMAEKVEKDKEKVDMAEKVEKEKEKIDKAEKMDKEKTDKTEKVDKGKEKMDKKEKPNKAEKARKADSSEKPDKTAKVEKAEKAVKEPGKTALANGTGAAPGKGLSAADKKAKPTTGLTKATSAKTRPNSLSTGDATPKGPPPASNSSSATLNKKSPVSKATTPTTGTKRPGPTANRSLSATEPREVKAKTTDGRTTERLPPVPKANATPPARASVTKNGSPTTAAAKPAGAPRATPVPRTSTSAPSLRRTTPAKSESKAGEAKKPSTLKTTTDSSRPRTTPTRTSSTAPGTPGAAPGSTKPAVSNAAVPERKPPVPRAPRAAPRPGTAPPPDIKNVRSKIGSTDNMKHQPGGGKVSTSQGRTDTLAKGSLCKETSQGKVQIVSKKLDFSHVTSRCGSKDNIKHVPGGGHIQIRNKKVDLSKVTSKCGSKANIKHKPGGGDVKIESHKIKIKAQSKVGSMDNMNHNPGGGNVKAEGLQETAEGNVAPAIGTLPTLAGSVARENGLKEGVACRGEGLRDPQGLDTHIPETN